MRLYQKCLLLEEMEELPFEAIGISSQMHGIVYVNGKGEAVSPFYTWKEESGNQPLDEKETYAGYLSRITGYPLYTGYGSVTHFYLQKTGALPADAEGFVDIGDYLAMRLTGSVRRAVNESIAASFGGYDLENRCFDHDALKKPELMCRFIRKYVRTMSSSVTIRERKFFRQSEIIRRAFWEQFPNRKKHRDQCGNRFPGFRLFPKTLCGVYGKWYRRAAFSRRRLFVCGRILERRKGI